MNRLTLLSLGALLLLAVAVNAVGNDFESDCRNPQSDCRSIVSLSTEADYAIITGTQGELRFWATNNANETRFVSFSAYVGELTAFIDEPFAALQPNAAKSTYIRFNAPDCFRGVEDVYLKARSCNADGTSCAERTKTIHVFVTPTADCSYHINGSLGTEAYVAPLVRGRPSSTLTYVKYFDPTEYDVRVSGAEKCIDFYAGDWKRVPLTLLNRGAAGTFDLRLLGDTDKINAMLGSEYVSLTRNDASDVFIDVQPGRDSGRYWVTLQVLNGVSVITEKDVCINVVDKYEASLLMPKYVRVPDCSGVTIRGLAENLGTAEDVYAIMTDKFAAASEDTITVRAGERGQFDVVIDGSTLQKGTTTLHVGIASVETSKMVAEATTQLEVVSCSAASSVNATQTQEAESVRVTVNVVNDLNTSLDNVSASVAGIPATWKVQAESGVSIAPQSSRNLTVIITPTTSEEAVAPQLIVKSGDRIIGQQALPPISPKPAGLTGFVVTALSQNMMLIAVLVAIALLVIVLSGRRKTEEEEYREKLQTIKKSITE
ncbi:Uncharacterised protein [Candidatus Norongarragalina meridionalis]|nr:Uncharacterised protein [Candidatus Norongarragalina meridionalis]